MQTLEATLKTTISFHEIRDATCNLCATTLFTLREDIALALQKSIQTEEQPARYYLELLLKNAELANKSQIPLAQDVGMPIFFAEVGDHVDIEGGCLREAMQEGLQQFIQRYPFRFSIFEEPLFSQRQYSDYIPLRLYVDYNSGDQIKLRCIRVHADSEHVSRNAIFSADNLEMALQDFILKTVIHAQLRASPPLLIGVGLGGTLADVGLLAKKALLRPLGKPPQSLASARLEKDLLNTVNQLNIGPGGIGGKTTALAIHIEVAPAMTNAIPLAVHLMGGTPCMGESIIAATETDN